MAVRESRTKVSSWANFQKQLTLSNYLTACAKRKLITHLSLRTDSFRSMSRQSMTWLWIYRDDSPYECESLMNVPGKNPYVCFHRLRTELLTYLFEVPRAENDCLELLQLTFKALTICLSWALINSLSQRHFPITDFEFANLSPWIAPGSDADENSPLNYNGWEQTRINDNLLNSRLAFRPDKSSASFLLLAHNTSLVAWAINDQITPWSLFALGPQTFVLLYEALQLLSDSWFIKDSDKNQ